MSSQPFSPQDFGLITDYLYEILATTYSINSYSGQISPNTACMGIKLLKNKRLIINPYPETTTFKNLKEKSLIAINFVDNVYLYALAALKDPNSLIGVKDFPEKYYDYQTLETYGKDIPYIKKAWGIIIGKVSKELKKTKNDSFGEVIIPIFILDVIFAKKIRNSSKSINRAENLTIEAIILATRLEIAKKSNNEVLFSQIHKQILYYIENIKRFGANAEALQAIEIVDNYLNSLID